MKRLRKIKVALQKCAAELAMIARGVDPESVKVAQAMDDLRAIRNELSFPRATSSR